MQYIIDFFNSFTFHLNIYEYTNSIVLILFTYLIFTCTIFYGLVNISIYLLSLYILNNNNNYIKNLPNNYPIINKIIIFYSDYTIDYILLVLLILLVLIGFIIYFSIIMIFRYSYIF